VAVVLTLVTNKNTYTQKEQYKNTVNTSTHVTKTPTHIYMILWQNLIPTWRMRSSNAKKYRYMCQAGVRMNLLYAAYIKSCYNENEIV